MPLAGLPSRQLPNDARQVVGGNYHVESREAILKLEAAMRTEIETGRMPEAKFTHRHFFAPGVYLREIFMPAGSIFTGRIHKHEHLSIIHSGKVTTVTQDGVVTIDVGPGDPPYVMVAPPGIKRALYMHTDVRWSCIHLNPTNERDEAKLEEMITAGSFAEFEQLLLTQGER